MSLHGFHAEPTANRANPDWDFGAQSLSSSARLRGSAPLSITWFEDQTVVDAHISCLLVQYDGLPTGPVSDTVIDPPVDWVFERPIDRELSDALADVDGSSDEAAAVVAPGGPGRSVMVLLDSHDGALVTVNLSGNHRRARYSQADDLPDAFLREALADLVGS